MPKPLKDLGNCPACSNADVNAIWYGMPTWDYEQTWPSNAQVGGCLVSDSNPDRACTNCGHTWISPDGNRLGL